MLPAMIMPPFLFLFIASAGSVLVADSETSHPFVDLQVAGLVVGKNNIHQAFLLYGDKGIRTEGFHGDNWCFYSEQDMAYLLLALHESTIETITIYNLTTKIGQQCKKSVIRNTKLTSGKGIGLGDSSQKVLKTYGPPGKKYSKNGLLVIEYHTDYEQDRDVRLYYDAYLYFKNGKLVKLIVHDGE